MARRARFLWGAALYYFVALWCGGAALELMVRAQNATFGALLVALVAFSILLGGVFALVGEWFGAKGTLQGVRVAWTLLLLSLAGWYFGGLALVENPFFAIRAGQKWPDGWLLALVGAQFLGAACFVRATRNFALLTFQFLMVFLALWHPRVGDSPTVAAVFALAAFAFLGQFLESRPRFFALFWWLFGGSCAGTPLYFSDFSLSNWQLQSAILWRETAFLPAFCGLIWIGFWWFFSLRWAFWMAVWERTELSALFKSSLLCAVFATIFLGPSAAIGCLFFPFAGLFFDLLNFDEPSRKTAARAEFAAAKTASISVDSGQFESD